MQCPAILGGDMSFFTADVLACQNRKSTGVTCYINNVLFKGPIEPTGTIETCVFGEERTIVNKKSAMFRMFQPHDLSHINQKCSQTV